MTLPSLTLAHRYVLESALASGGMATVWQARDDVLARPVAVKILHPQLSADEAFVERFRREALSAARLAHPHIVSIFDTGSEKHDDDGIERHFIVMEFCAGGTLADLIKERGALAPGDAADVTATICDAIAYAHRHGIVHRDIKPQNVLLTDHRSLKVADFGIAKAAFSKSDITTTGAILGTVTYLSPEQVLGEEPGPRSDIYSVGVVLHELLTGKPPFQADTQIATAMAHARNDPPPVRTLRAGIPRHLEEIVLQALQKDPANRFESAEDMAAALRGGAPAARPTSDASSTAVLQRPEPQPDEQPPPGRARPAGSWLRWLLPVLLVVAGAVLAALVIPNLLEDERATGGPGEPPPEEAEPLDVAQVTSLDSLPGETEHPEEAHLAIDGDPATTWGTETYDTPMHEFKEGVGLVFDLGTPTEVGTIRLQSPTPGFDVRVLVSDQAAESLDEFEAVTEATEVPERADVAVDPPVEARYWLVLLTRLPGDGSGSAEIGEVKLFGP